MIVNPTDTGWEVIYHRAHALLAAQIAGHWRRKDRPARIIETVAAISHHDDLEREWEGDHLTQAGAPQDFTLGQATSVPKLVEHIANSRYRGRWVALLTSLHMSFLNEGKRGESPELDRFLDEQLQNQKQWQKHLDVSKDDVAKAYAFFQWCDRLSLILCQQQLPEDERALEIGRGPDDERYDILQYSNGDVTVKPWPFEDKAFTVNVEASHLSQIKFENNAALVEALQVAPLKTLEWNFVKHN